MSVKLVLAAARRVLWCPWSIAYATLFYTGFL
jgi:hypothetical protein